jgi:hypothetical protein
MKYQNWMANKLTRQSFRRCNLNRYLSAIACTLTLSALSIPAYADDPSLSAPIEPATVEPATVEEATDESAPLNLSPEVIEQSPVLQRWLEEIPDVRADIRHDPSFVTRVQVGYSVFPSSAGTGGFVIALEDWFIGQTPLSVSADYQQNFQGDRQAYGTDLHYYLLPLGGYFNIAPTLGYRAARSADDYSVNGAHVGLRLRLVPSRTGAADLTLDQSWIVGDSEGLSITQLNVGYAITQQLRLSTDLEWQRSADAGDSRVGINLEWSP